MPRAGVPGIDLLAIDLQGIQVAIQVKTASNAFHEKKRDKKDSWFKWRVGSKPTEPKGRSFYVFVDLGKSTINTTGEPLALIVPWNDVHRGIDNKDPMFYKIAASTAEKYRNAWDLITK